MSATRTSKFLSLVLRHDPARIGITLDDAGWTDVAALLAACAAHGVVISRAELASIVETSDKQRFALSPDGERIRANQGHSVEVELGLPVATPPARLYHGTVEAALAGIRAEGLRKGARHDVHLSAERGTATKVGQRRGAPLILTIHADDMVAAGHAFRVSANGVWLTAHVPPQFIDFPPPSAAAVHTGSSRTRGEKVAIARETLAACEAGRYVNARHEVVDIAQAIERAKRDTVLFDLSTYPAAHEELIGNLETVIRVTDESTLAAIHRMGQGRPGLICLNFASAKNPGGGFLGGAQAQEESLARSSALYPCQLTQPQHYARNRANHSAHYLDLAIYSPNVPFFRDDDGGWFDAPVECSVITCAAPNAGALRQHGRFDAAEVEATLRRRARLVLQIARDDAHADRLILGAWGAGVFGNDPAMVARVFHELIAQRFRGWFSEIVFAIPGGPGKANYDAFVKELGEHQVVVLR